MSARRRESQKCKKDFGERERRARKIQETKRQDQECKKDFGENDILECKKDFGEKEVGEQERLRNERVRSARKSYK